MGEHYSTISQKDWEKFQKDLPLSSLAQAKTFKEYLDLERKSKGLTQKKLAEMSGISVTTLRRYSLDPYHSLSSTYIGVFRALEISSSDREDVWKKFIQPNEIS